MDEKSCVIYIGPKFTLEWYYDKNGKSVGFDYFVEMAKEQRRKFLALVKRMVFTRLNPSLTGICRFSLMTKK